MEKKLQTKSVIKIVAAVIMAAFVLLIIFRTSIFPTESTIYNLYDWSVEDQLGVKLLKTLVIICVGALVIMLANAVSALGAKEKNSTVKTVTLLVGNVLKYLAVIGMILKTLSAWGVDTTVLVTGASVLALIIGLGCQSLVADIVAGLFLIFEGDIKVGDIVVINGWRGTVTQIGLRRTKIEDAVGNVNIVNNSAISNIINNTRQLSVAVVEVGIEYNESIQRVESVLSEEMKSFKEHIPAIVEGPYYKGVSSLGDSSVVIKLVAKCNEADKYQVERDMNREIKIIFDKHDINIPFNQVVLNYRDEDETLTQAKRSEMKKAEAFVKEQKELSKDIEEQKS